MNGYLGFSNENLRQKSKLLDEDFGFEINLEAYPRLQLEADGLFYLVSTSTFAYKNKTPFKHLKTIHGMACGCGFYY